MYLKSATKIPTSLQWNNKFADKLTISNYKQEIIQKGQPLQACDWKGMRITYSFFNGHFCVYPMLIIQINVFHIKTLQASLTAWANILRATIHFYIRKCQCLDAKFGCYLNFFSWQLLQGLKDINFFQIISQSFNLVLNY